VSGIPLSSIAQYLGSSGASRNISITGMALDSRKVVDGDLFVAIEGAQRDGHEFIETARDNGAAAALVSRNIATDMPVLQVENTVAASAEIGRFARQRFTGTVVGITGSAGKTTAKTLLSAVLSRAGTTIATIGNENNELGVPLTLSRLFQQPEYAVIEMGAAQLGDIRYLRSLAQPDLVVLLNALDAHVGRFGGIDAIAEAKGEILDELSADQVAVINADQAWTEVWCERALPARIVTFGMSEHANVRAMEIEDEGVRGSRISVDSFGRRFEVSICVPGRAGVMNALATIAAATALGVSLDLVVAGLETADVVPGRGELKQLDNGVNLIDDSYNASPASVMASIDVLAKAPSPRIAVLGDMLELGDQSQRFHSEVGKATDLASIDQVIAVGPAAKGIADARQGASIHVDSVDHLIIDLPEFPANSTILIKGSRSVGLDRLVTALTQPFGATAC
jgi:UDP-N-acetylmuramoyl-tripeptide--D-alanyl-D-alanine ligase